MARLRRVDCAGPGITRRRGGRGFEYLDEEGRRIADREVVERIADLAIPPAWREVWISPHAMGHLQATGIDDAGRKQYLYHRKWRERRDQQKFDSMVDFARALPLMRRRVARDLDLTWRAWAASACSRARFVCSTGASSASEARATRPRSTHTASIEKGHIQLGDDRLEFDYASKSGMRRVQSVVDHDVHDIVAALKRRRQGPELLAYKDGRRWIDVRSEDINAYVKEVTGGDFTAEDFRTWNATVMAAVSARVATGSNTGRKRAETRAVKDVAGYLGNTPAVTRASYIDPRVFDRFRSGWTIGGVLPQVGDSGDIGSLHGPIEDAVLDLLAGGESPAVEQAAA